MRELIVYATPTGELAESCSRYFAAATDLGPTTAQTYPPHITMTGFFHRPWARVPAVAADVAGAIDGQTPAVAVLRLEVAADWVGLVIESHDLIAVARRFAAEHVRLPGDDPIRVKTWLHLSLAYGIDDVTAHAALAATMVDPHADADWEIGLWERHADGRWSIHV